ncbi:hypothetical protein M2107_005183 [Paenibacillus sp. PastM-2]|nr:hypothetical protein [Paenibacillus sp. PastM-2]
MRRFFVTIYIEFAKIYISQKGFQNSPQFSGQQKTSPHPQDKRRLKRVTAAQKGQLYFQLPKLDQLDNRLRTAFDV